MVGFITKSLLSLVPKPKTPVARKLTTQIQRSVDDIAIPYIRPNNYPQAITVSDADRFDITALVFLKTWGAIRTTAPRSVKEANYWRESSPFWNSSTIKRKLWSKLFHQVNLKDAKQIIAREVMDKLYKDIYQSHLPIIGVRVVLFNGTTNQVIDPRILRDPWFSNTAFNNVKIDKRTLNSWGVQSGSFEQGSIDPKRPSLPYALGTVTTVNLESKLNEIDIDLDALIKASLLNAEDKLKEIDDFRTRYKIKSSLRSLLNSSKFKTILGKFFVAKLRTVKFGKTFTVSDSRADLVGSIIDQIVSDYIDKELEKK